MTGFLDRSICFQGWDLDLHHSPAAPSPNKLAPKTQNQKKNHTLNQLLILSSLTAKVRPHPGPVRLNVF